MGKEGPSVVLFRPNGAINIEVTEFDGCAGVSAKTVVVAAIVR